MELLTVIGIIAILAAILFPVIGRAKAQVKKTQCMSNLAQLCPALKMYKNDYHAPPYCLLPYMGPAVEPVDLNQFNIPMLEYVKQPEAFHCPMALQYRYNFNELLLARPRPGGKPDVVDVYTYSSYDGAPFVVGANGALTYYDGTVAKSQYAYDPHRWWQGTTPNVNTKRNLFNREDEASAVVAWCPFHRDYKRVAKGGLVLGRGSIDIVLFWSGAAKPIPSTQNMPLNDPTLWGFVESP